MLRQLYKSKMRFYRDDKTVEIAGRWRWCPPGARPLPFPHVFSSSAYDGRECRDYQHQGVGEIKPNHFTRLKPATLKGVDGKNYCGNIEDWQKGCLISQAGHVQVNDDGNYLCCNPTPVVGDGGSSDSGEGSVVIVSALAYAAQSDSGQGSVIKTIPTEGGSSSSGLGQVELVPAGTTEGGSSSSGPGQVELVPTPTTEGGSSDSGEGTVELVPIVFPCARLNVPSTQQFGFTIAGVADDVCTDCELVNGTFSVAWIAGCDWGAPAPDICGGSGTVWSLLIFPGTSSGNLIQLVLQGGGIGLSPYWQVDNSPWDGTTSVVLTLTSATCCNSWPSTITLSPL